MESPEEEIDKKQWFVMRDLRRKSVDKSGAKLSAWEILRNNGMEVFVPMKWVAETRRGIKTKRHLVPAIPDLVFLHDTYDNVERVHSSTLGLTFRYMKGSAYKKPMVVAEKEMDHFINALNNSNEAVVLTAEELSRYRIGSRIKVTEGPMEGLEGSLVSIKGSKKKRLVVNLQGLVSVMVEISPESICLMD